MLLSAAGDVTTEFGYIERKHRALRDKHGVELDRRTFLHWVAWGHLRRKQRLRAARMFLRSGLETGAVRDLGLAAAYIVRAALPVPWLRPALHALRRSRTSSGFLPPNEPAWLELYR